jgi:hypothetical protein
VRIRVERIEEGEPWGESFVTYRLCEQDGTVCCNWLPGIELDGEPLDCGGFESKSDAQGFALGIDRERALFGLLPGLTVEDIDHERAKLDHSTKKLDALDRMDDGVQLDLGKLLEAVSEQAAPVVEHRRRVA